MLEFVSCMEAANHVSVFFNGLDLFSMPFAWPHDRKIKFAVAAQFHSHQNIEMGFIDQARHSKSMMTIRTERL